MFETGIRQDGVKPFSLDATGSNDSPLKKLNHTRPLNIDENKNQEKPGLHVPEIDHGNLGIIKNPQNMIRNRAGTFGTGVIDDDERK